MIFGKKSQAGLDIGTYSLQWGAIEPRSGKSEVWRAPIHSHQVRNVSDPSYGEKVGSLLRRCRRNAGSMWNPTCVVGIQGVGVVNGYLEFPRLQESELDMAVLSSVSREIPFAIDTMEVVHLPVAPLEHGKTAVFYSAWPKTESRRLAEICQACDLKVKRFEATGIALTRELFRNRSLDPEAFYAILNIGHEMTQIVLVRGGYPYYLRDIPVGGRDITYGIAVSAQISWEEAEKHKSEVPLFEFFPSAGPALGELSHEVERSLKYFQRTFKVEQVESLFLSGGTSLIQDLPEWLEGELSLPVVPESWEEIQPRQVETDGDARLNKVALGLALAQ